MIYEGAAKYTKTTVEIEDESVVVLRIYAANCYDAMAIHDVMAASTGASAGDLHIKLSYRAQHHAVTATGRRAIPQIDAFYCKTVYADLAKAWRIVIAITAAMFIRLLPW